MTGNEDSFKSYSDGNIDRMVIEGRARVAGQYRCIACNLLGCSSKSSVANISISGKIQFKNIDIKSSIKELQYLFKIDVSSSYEVLTRSRKDDPVEGERFNITCQVSLYDYLNQSFLWWWKDMNGNIRPILPSNPLNILGISR